MSASTHPQSFIPSPQEQIPEHPPIPERPTRNDKPSTVSIHLDSFHPITIVILVFAAFYLLQ